MPLYIQTDRGYSATMSGLIMLPGVSASASPSSSAAARWIGSRAPGGFVRFDCVDPWHLGHVAGGDGYVDLVGIDLPVHPSDRHGFPADADYHVVPELPERAERSVRRIIGDEYRASDCGRCGRTCVGDSDGTFAALHKQGAPPPSPLDFRHSMGAANLRNDLSGNGVDGVLRRQGRRCRSYARHYFLACAARTACAAYGCELTADSTILNIIRNPGSNTGASYYVVLSQDFSWSLLRPAHQRQDNQQHVERHNQCHHNHKNHVLDGSISPLAHEFLVMRVSHQRNHGERGCRWKAPPGR